MSTAKKQSRIVITKANWHGWTSDEQIRDTNRQSADELLNHLKNKYKLFFILTQQMYSYYTSSDSCYNDTSCSRWKKKIGTNTKDP